ncbi:MAG TPA: formylglycine-generating enzyme family protein [Verrucomicrobiae bacterium]|jgi:formylglycine-generating enzyme required for sulfatase activity
MLTVWEKAARKADLTLKLPGGIPMFFRRIPAGSFRMGARGEGADEEPMHQVVVTREFLLGTFVVTQEQYRAVASRCPALKKQSDPSHFKGPRRPVEQISWHDATAFCQWLRCWRGLPKEIREVRLPDEAEWEYACRADSETEYYNGDGEAALANVAWFEKNSGNESHAVDERPESHPFGLYGMHGNIWEWCLGVHDSNAYRKREDGWEAREWVLSEKGKDRARVLRGGSWYDTARGCRSAYRDRLRPDVRYRNFGLRVCLVRGPAGPADNRAASAPGDGGRGTRLESDGAGGGPHGTPSGASHVSPRSGSKKMNKAA